ncbi:MAG: ABC transporter ATP-binding protein/permease [Bacilli bacterium]|nr:ABC transporter ATP-binding protein/permease [Bacilli bacterium]
MKDLFKIYLRVYQKKHIVFSIFAILFLIFDVLIALIIPSITKGIFDEINSEGNRLSYIYRTGAIVVGIALVAVLITVMNNIFTQRVSTRITAELRKDLFSKIQELSFSNVDEITTGTLITIVSNDTAQIQQIIMMSFRAILRSPLTLIGAILMAYLINQQLFVIILLIVPILSLFIIIIIKKASSTFLIMQERIDDLNTKLNETVSGAREIKAFVTEEQEMERFNLVNDNHSNTIIKAYKRIANIDPLIILISNIGIGAVLIFAGYLVSILTGEARTEMVGTIAAYISYLQQIIMSLMMLSMVAVQLSRGAISAQRIQKVLNIRPSIENKAEPIIVDNFKGRIEYRDVSFGYGYGDGHNEAVGLTLKNISFVIEPKSTVGIIGSTGSGKTTLVQLLPRLYDVTSGTIYLDGIDIRDIDLSFLRQQISYVTQEAIIFSGTITDNIRQGKEDANLEEIEQAARFAAADEFIYKTEKEFNNEVTQGGTNLSGGQRQRLSLARALIREPKIIILDDSTSAVDAKSEAKIKDNVYSSKKQTTIIIAQKISSIRNCDKIIVLDNSGRLDGFGTHKELLKESEVYREIYNSQFGGNDE